MNKRRAPVVVRTTPAKPADELLNIPPDESTSHSGGPYKGRYPWDVIRRLYVTARKWLGDSP